MTRKRSSKTSAQTESTKRPKGYAGRGHPKLSPQAKRAIRMRAARGETQASIGERFGVSARAVGKVLDEDDAKGEGSTRRRRQSGKLTGEGGDAVAVTVKAEDRDPRGKLELLIAQTRELRERAKKDGNSTAFVRLSTLEADLGKRLTELDAQKPPDPRDDPANREARDLLLHLLQLTLEGGDEQPPERETEVDG